MICTCDDWTIMFLYGVFDEIDFFVNLKLCLVDATKRALSYFGDKVENFFDPL
jgi:hypothetical protein